MTSLRLETPLSYHADTRLPAPRWLIEATPGAKPLLAAFDKAVADAKAAIAARTAADAAFSEASRRNADNERIPLPSVDYDRWRGLQADLEAAKVAAEHPPRLAVKAAYLALREHLEESPKAATIAEERASERHAELLAHLDELDGKIAAFAEAEVLVPGVYGHRDGPYLRTFADRVKRVSRELRTLTSEAKR